MHIHDLTFDEKERRKNSNIISFAIHLLLLILLFFLPIFGSSPIQETVQGIVVNFGNPNAGTPQENPLKEFTPTSAKAEEAPKEEIEEVEKQRTVAPTKTEIKSKIIEKESSVVISEPVKKEVKEIEKVNEIEVSSSPAQEEKVNEEEQIEAELIEAKARFGSLFNNNSKGEIPTEKGDEFGKPSSDILAGHSTGKGEIGEGLDGRDIIYEPEIKDNSQKKGVVMIKICVDKEGNVINARYTQQGSTTTDNYLVDLGIKSARKYKFSPSKVEEQCGVIGIEFIVK